MRSSYNIVSFFIKGRSYMSSYQVETNAKLLGFNTLHDALMTSLICALNDVIKNGYSDIT